MTNSVGAVVVAAGSGERFGAAVPKALVELAGRPLVRWAVEAIVGAGVRQVVVAAPPGHLEEVAAALADVVDANIVVVEGGQTRSASVRLAFGALAPLPELVLVHDAARAMMPVGIIASVIAAIGGDVLAAAPGLAVVDTLKRVGSDGTIRSTIDRSDAWAVQTPQVFTSDVLKAVHAWAGDRDATDDLALFEDAVAAGAVRGRAVMVEGHADGAKITHAQDLERAALHLRGAPEQPGSPVPEGPT
ncbi:MAG: 2-C-methyl-D-erythritol 4-phosphate cytidylyltransferase [Glaciecola sp.]|jgi:2-C-methyl-D-erythritol 4-phosphate cytidylyltransferase